MDTFPEIVYISGHETLWETGNTGKAETARSAPSKIWPQLSLCGHTSEIIVKFSRALVPTVPQEWLDWASAPANSGPPFTLVQEREARACRGSVAGSIESGISDRFVDTETNWRSDRQALWNRVYRSQHLAVDAGSGVELSATGETGQREKRTHNSFVETSGLARDKKKLNGLRLISFSWMKAGFCWYQAFAAHGLLGEELHVWKWQETGTRSLPFPASVSLPKRGTWPSTSDSTPTKISDRGKWLNFLHVFSGIFEALSSFCGIIIPLIGETSSSTSFINTLVSTAIISQDMRPNLTQMNMSGPISSVLLPTVSRKISDIFSACFTDRPGGSNTLNDYCGRAFTHPIYHGDEITVSFIY